ncbi:MAG TPA: sigma-70 family RNA polymerase sigma factor [Ktedonobacteraceae bacterium]|jgi:RNA polymerase primary sigma factor|nr:sigma-70 family RNA polymerase sigma factor [Ktedonobacteraceae bacterium]
MSIVLPEREKVEEYMMAQTMTSTRVRKEQQLRPAHGSDAQGADWVEENGLGVFEGLTALVGEPIERVYARPTGVQRVDTETERLRANDPSRLYRDEVGHADLLTPEEVNHLAQCIERGRAAAMRPNLPGHREIIEAGERAKNRLIEANLRLVIHVARRYKCFEMDLMDLIQEGNLGLIHAVDKYDYRKGYKFSTYAIWWIRQAITRALTEQAQMIRVPLYKMEKIKQLMKARQNLEQGLEKEPTLEDLAEQMEVDVEQVIELLMMIQAQDPLSLDIRRRVGEDEIPLSDLLEDDQVNSPERIVIAQTLEVLIRELLNDLTPRERSVIRLRYGLDDGHEHTLNEVGRKLGLSHEAVRQIECRALKKLDPLSRKRKLEEFLA